MTEPKQSPLGELLEIRRRALRLSISEVARRASMDKSTLSLLERGRTRPRLESLRALANVLGMPVGELFAAADFMQPTDLPPLRPYMRAKYRDLPDEAVAEVEQFINDLAAKHRSRGPLPGEDE